MVKSFAARKQRLVKVKVGDLVPAPWNFREHSQRQKDAFTKTIDDLGFYGYPDVFQDESGNHVLIDGHLRREWLLEHYGEAAVIQVNCVELTEDEAKLATATHDPISEMATKNAEKLQGLLRSLPSLAFHRPPMPELPPAADVAGTKERLTTRATGSDQNEKRQEGQRYPLAITVTREIRDRWQAWKAEREVSSDSEAFECLFGEVDA